MTKSMYNRLLYRYLGILFSFFLVLFSVQAQSYSVEGKVVDANGDPLVGATVTLEKEATHQKRGAVTDLEGRFTITRVSQGGYSLTASFVGYKNEKQRLQISRNMSLQPIAMQEDSQVLDQVVVTGKATEVTVKGDTLVFNADSYKVPQGGMLQDLIKRLPGVEIGTDGSITVNGEAVSKIMIDGKEFFAGDPKLATQNLPAEIVKQVEVHNKKSDNARMSGFDDDEEETVINLTTKRTSKTGTMGNLMLGYAPKSLYESNLMINRVTETAQWTLLGALNNTNNRENGGGPGNGNGGAGNGNGAGGRNFGGGAPGSNTSTGGGNFSIGSLPRGGISTRGNLGFNGSYTPSDVWNLNGNLRYNYRDRNLTARVQSQEQLPNGEMNYGTENLASSEKRQGLGADGYVDYRPSDTFELMYRPMFYFQKGKSLFDSQYETYNNDKEILNRGTLSQESQSSEYNFFNDLNLSHRLNDRGRTLSYSLNFNIGRSQEDLQSLSELTLLGASDPQRVAQGQSLLSNNLNIRARLSYVEPIGEYFRIQAMIQWSQNKRNSLQEIDNLDPTTLAVLSNENSIDLQNVLSMYRGGLHLKYENKALTLTAGVNVSPTTMYSKQTVATLAQPQEITVRELFFSPMLNIDYAPSKQTSLKVRYWGRPQMPNASQMFAYTNTANALNQVTGNPNLKPYFSHGLATMFRSFLPTTKQSINARAFVYYNQNAITTDTQIDPTSGKRATTYINGPASYGVHFYGMFNTPIFLPELTFSLTSRNLYAVNHSLVNQTQNSNTQWMTGNEIALGYTYDWLYLRARLGVDYSSLTNSMTTSSSQHVVGYRSGGEMTLTLPYNFTIESDISYTQNTGYGEGYNKNILDWNASLAYSLGKKKALTLKLKAFDILNSGVDIYRTSSASSLIDVETNSLGRYLMFSVIYKIANL